MQQNEQILKVRDLRLHFPVRKGLLMRTVGAVKAVDGVSLDLRRGETLGLVGESGCGKSTLGRALLRLYRPNSGSIQLLGNEIAHLDDKALRPHRINIQMIFQDPYASLDPRMTVFDTIAEPLLTHRLAKDRSELERKVASLMSRVGLSPRFIKKYPHEFSGGQRQRIAIARAIAIEPQLIVCDEPISALDVSIQAQILNLLAQLQKELGIAYIFIAHDIAAVRHIADRIAVMYLGKIVEQAPTDELFANPQHPYTQALLSAAPIPDPIKERARQRILLRGDLPSPINPPNGCHFHTRCPVAFDACKTKVPELTKVGAHHVASCLRLKGH